MGCTNGFANFYHPCLLLHSNDACIIYSLVYFYLIYFVYFGNTCIQAVWIRVPQSIKKSVETKNFSFRGGLHAASHALLNVVPL